MRSFGIFIILASFLFKLPASAQEGFMWRPSTVSISIETDNLYTKLGQYLLLSNEVGENESAWSMLKMDLPESWQIELLVFTDEAITFKNQMSEHFQIAPPKLNELFSELIENEGQGEEKIELLWRKFALK
jgi:hypothetical protein